MISQVPRVVAPAPLDTPRLAVGARSPEGVGLALPRAGPEVAAEEGDVPLVVREPGGGIPVLPRTTGAADGKLKHIVSADIQY